MIFDDAMEFEIDEYYAPPLAEQARGAAESGHRGAGRLSRQASASELSRQQSDGMDQVILSRLRDWIVESRDDLQYHFESKDPGCTDLISPAVRDPSACVRVAS